MSKPEAIVWGAAGAIGSALRTKLEDEGWNVTSIVHSLDTVTDPDSIQANAGDPSSVQAALVDMSQRLEKIDLLIYAAGDITHSELVNLELHDWRRILDANLTGPYLVLNSCLPLLAENAGIIVIGAQQERLRLPGLSAYAAAKAGVEALIETLRKEQRSRQVMLIRPAAVQTPFWEKVPFTMPKGAMKPEDLADEILAAYKEGKQGALDF